MTPKGFHKKNVNYLYPNRYGVDIQALELASGK